MDKAIDELLKVIDNEEGVQVERLRKRVSKDYAERTETKGLVWFLRDGTKVVDLGHVCTGKVGQISGTSFEVLAPSEVSKSKVKKVLKIKQYPRFYLFSGESQYYDVTFRHYLESRGLYPYPDTKSTTDGSLIFLRYNINRPKYRGIDYVYYLNVEVVDEYTTYDRDTFLIRCHIHNMSDPNYLINIIEKDAFHFALEGNKYLAKTWPLERFTYTSGTYVMRPQSVESCSGKDVFFVNSKEQFDKALEIYQKRKEKICSRYFRDERKKKYEVIVSEYISDIVLWKGRKMHLRLYGIMTSETTTFKISRFGKILTAAQPYKLDEFDNDLIHDTHLKSSPRDIFYPEEFERLDLLPFINQQLDELEVILAGLGQARPYSGQADKSYMFFGLDLLVRKSGHLILMEVNHKVGMSTILQGTKESVAFGIRVDDWKWENIKFLFD